MSDLYKVKAELFRTLGHPARIRILELLAERDRPVHELLASIDIEQSNLSQQLAVLRRAGLVSQHRESGEVRYAASVPAVVELLRVARMLLVDILQGQQTLRAELEDATEEPAPALPTHDA
ncbi:MAG: transcriptional regulator [Cellulomonas sp. 73-92]|uniref:ArsR/SmtB family transcription factor n=1 Tax=Cellulomonas sp. 73-92 TaxID=1895740 RepID=UPI000927C3E4|nr:metalloregulator ArsR/SmtB family transcription factor [Cellulomonas sp. 73-92]OJV83470.1 MAG: transcriptional regulator [Cellulomonas sp. 73-92]